MERLVKLLLEFLAKDEWYIQPPKGIGKNTVNLCIERGLVKTKRAIIENKQGVETFFTPLRITKLGKIVYLEDKFRWAAQKIPYELVEYQLKNLRRLIGVGAVRSLQLNKAKVIVWRRTTPHNWWVENHKGKTLWHSDERKQRPDLRMLELVAHSEHRIYTGMPSYIVGDEGAPEESIYRLKKCYCKG